MRTITPFLWFTDQAEQAAEFYVSLFGGRIVDVTRNPDGSAFVVRWEMDGVEYAGMNAARGPALDEAFSLSVDAGEQDRVDELWDALLADGGTPSQCGWLVDRFGVSWQIVPTRLAELMQGPNGAAVTAALMTMSKIDIGVLEAASQA